MKCPVCGQAELQAGTRDLPYVYKGESHVIAAVSGQFCPQCGESVLEPGKAAEIFGGGINAFSRYENGKTKPPLALVKLLRWLDRHPERLNEMRAA